MSRELEESRLQILREYAILDTEDDSADIAEAFEDASSLFRFKSSSQMRARVAPLVFLFERAGVIARLPVSGA